jgi:hypothetical protein
MSTNSGGDWTATSAPVEYWTCIASSADGSKLTATSYPGGIYTWQSLPMLNIAPSSGNLVISWQALSSATGFAPQANSDLATTNWIVLTNLPVLTNGWIQVVIPRPLGGNQFYRLEKP